MLLNVGSGGSAAAAAPTGGAAGGAAAEAPAAAAEEEKKEEGKLSHAPLSATTLLFYFLLSDLTCAHREGGIRRGHGLWSLRLDYNPRYPLFCHHIPLVLGYEHSGVKEGEG